MVETAEEVAEVVEKVAEEVDKVAEEISEHLPEGGKLSVAVKIIEKAAEKTAKDAELVEDVIDKVIPNTLSFFKVIVNKAPIVSNYQLHSLLLYFCFIISKFH